MHDTRIMLTDRSRTRRQLGAVTIDILSRLPAMMIAGTSANQAREICETARSAILACGGDIPRKRIVATISPADIGAPCPAFGVAVAILGATSPLPEGQLSAVYHGELGLDGKIRPFPGVMDAAIHARDAGLPLVTDPESAARVAAVIPGVHVLAVQSLGDLSARTIRASVADLATVTSGGWRLAPAKIGTLIPAPRDADPRVAAALATMRPGGVVAFIGATPGKVAMVRHLARQAAPTLDAILAHDRAGLADIPRHAPVRAPHHTIGQAGAVGECALANGGWIVLDDLQHFQLAALWSALHHRGTARLVLAGSGPRARKLATSVHATVVDLGTDDDDWFSDDEPTERIARPVSP